MVQVVITGGAGFIGSHLAEKLLKEGHTVTIIDNLSTGLLINLEAIKNHRRFSFFQLDICSGVAIRPLFKNQDWVFHLAGATDVVPSIEDPRLYFEKNLEGTFNVLEAARLSNVKRFIYAASSSCYGSTVEIPTTESAHICAEHPYGVSKYLAEQMVLYWGKIYNLPALSLRLFNVYGPRAKTSGLYSAVLGTFLMQKKQGIPLTIVGNGRQTRDFIFVSDVVNAFLAAAMSNLEGEAFNVGCGKECSIQELASYIGETFCYLPERQNDPKRSCAEISKIKTSLNWTPEISFEDGIKKMLAIH